MNSLASETCTRTEHQN